MRKQFLLWLTIALCVSANRPVKAQKSFVRDALNYPPIARPERKEIGYEIAKTSANTSLQRVDNSYNLVTNGDFEDQNVSPSGFYANVYVQPDPYTLNEVYHWESTNYATPDYFATNGPSSPANPSSAFPGSFIPYNYIRGEHNGCIGIGSATINYPSNAPYVEYFTQKLKSPLTVGREYYVSMQVYNARNVKYASSIGIDITPTDPRNFSYINASTRSPYVFTATGQGIQSSATTPISATQWTLLSTKFTANAAGEYINIGNFQPLQPLVLVRPNATSTYVNDNAYYYIDDVQVFMVPNAGSSAIFAVTCGASAVLGESGINIPGATYAWSASPSTGALPNTPQITVTPSSNTIYTLTVTLPDGSTHASSVTVEVYPAEMYAIDREDGTVCDNNTLYYIPLFNPGVMDPRYAATNGLTYAISGPPGQVSGTQFGYSPISGRFCVFVVPNRSLVQPSYELTITAHYASGCEASYTDYLGWDNSACWPWYYRVTPNPASTELTITSQSSLESDATVQGKANNTSPTCTEAWLYNGQGVLVKHGKSQTSSLTLDVHDLPEGIYHLRSGAEKNSISKSIEIRH